MLFDILTIFPGIVESPLQEGILRKAQEEKKIQIRITNIRDFAFDKHAVTDDRPYGGGEGMIMKAEPLFGALQSVRSENARVILLSPQGRQLTHTLANELSTEKHLILICGRYEGVDERFINLHVDDELSIGDYILSGGELAALVTLDAVTRLIPGVLGCEDSAGKDTFSRNLLKHPHYTRPPVWQEQEVPEVLLSGNHQEIEHYRFLMSVRRTLKRRPDLLRRESFSKKELKLLEKAGLAESLPRSQGKNEKP